MHGYNLTLFILPSCNHAMTIFSTLHLLSTYAFLFNFIAMPVLLIFQPVLFLSLLYYLHFFMVLLAISSTTARFRTVKYSVHSKIIVLIFFSF